MTLIKIGYIFKSINFNIKIVCISFYKYNFKYKKLLLYNIYLKVFDYRDEVIISDYVFIIYYKKSKYCNYKIVKIL
ncbi:apicoplast ribosomal protein S17, putative (apicoplast) [Plasmodium malariae]|uniref:Apicoplast ribosomal protein S17, putative n=1 Tax=Plasmodium malariae TaxID=5858 RepID=A0A1D3JJV0_PLAMA|nr:apicoplast ribosomal protein S17, putative [Plasmodium malariae]SBT86788.1 apicoplast ribosomal protein S17, putative [Plasmodium malariae]